MLIYSTKVTIVIWTSSPELFKELYDAETYACGTVWKNRKFSQSSVHMLNMLMLNAFILHNKFATEKTTHEGFREAVVKNLVEEGIKTYNLTSPPQISYRYEEDLRLSERHYPSFIPAAIGAKRARPTRPCHVCANLLVVDGVKLSKRWSSYWCSECKKALFGLLLHGLSYFQRLQN